MIPGEYLLGEGEIEANVGRPGCRVRTARVRFVGKREVGSELLSDDAYPAMNRLVSE